MQGNDTRKVPRTPFLHFCFVSKNAIHSHTNFNITELNIHQRFQKIQEQCFSQLSLSADELRWLFPGIDRNLGTYIPPPPDLEVIILGNRGNVVVTVIYNWCFWNSAVLWKRLFNLNAPPNGKLNQIASWLVEKHPTSEKRNWFHHCVPFQEPQGVVPPNFVTTNANFTMTNLFWRPV